MCLRLGDVVLQSIGRPADRARSHPVLAAGMDHDWQLMLLSRGVNGPKVSASKQRFALHDNQYRHEPLVASKPFDLLDRKGWGLHGHLD